MTPDSPPLPRAWLMVALLWFVAFFNYLVRIMLTTMHGSLVEAIPMSEADFGLLTSVFLWTYGLLSPFAGFLSDRFNRSRVILVSMIAWSAVTWVTAYATDFRQLLAMRALLGAAEACYLPAALALITDYHRGPTRSFAVGVHMTGIGLGSALGGLGGWLAQERSWHYAFSVVGAAGIVYGIALALVLRDAPREAGGAGAAAPRFGAALASLLSRGSFVMAASYWGLLGVAGWAVTGWMPVYVKEHFHVAQGAAGFFSTGFSSVPTIAGVLLGGAWADRWSRSRPRARILVPAIGLAVAAPGILLAANTTVLAVAMLGLVVFGLARSFSDSNMMPILCMVSDPRYRATGYGVLNCIACVVGGLAIYAGGALRDARIEISRIFEFAAAALLFCAWLLTLVRPRPAPEPPA
jgi:sugar phosphate permease